ncbi:metalloendoproteinase 1-like [Durio zibethinus]|uniref:Metalloendoproteinase 1-like n=1 Tax=Durio zibethinus TaxID=66656 RepID=A0A6P6BBH8_DURZI|nr:metalloendoproteinase 1-like [Durio zibethinus]
MLNLNAKLFPTIKAIRDPRCGVPDIIRNRTSNGTMGTVHSHNYGIFHLVAGYSFFPGYPKWTRYQLTHNFLPGVQLFGVQELSPMIARAFQKWAAVSPFRFQQVAQGSRDDISIGFYRYDHGDGYPFDGPLGNVIAHAFALEDGRFHYDADENWSFNPAANQMDLESVAVHEIGHNLGLDHSWDQNAVMYPTIQLGTTKTNLGQEDINGLRALYSY